MRVGLLIATMMIPAGAAAAPVTLTYDSYAETKTLLTPLGATSPVRLDGLLPDRGGSVLRQDFGFVAGASDLSLSAGWLIQPTAVRTLGVNIDLLDASNMLVVSDAFQGLDGFVARSQFVATGLTVGAAYTLRLTGTAIEGGRYQIDLAPGSTTPPAFPSPVIGTTSPGIGLFDTLEGRKTIGAFAPGSTLRLDGLIGESGSIDNFTELTLTGDTLSAGLVWLVAPGALRTVGVNFDLFDAFDTLVSSDSFLGVSGGQATSQFVATGLTPGLYRLRFTGTAQAGGRYRVTLGTDGTVQGLGRIGAEVPEPATWALLLVGFASVGVAARRARQGAVSAA